ncbi:MarR family transcriptional regulator [Rhizobium rhizogenes]|uniref:MarR family transcriptional regulator n=1 Tax=Rhizobium rhizogenes TaxID=359 RepID=UPI0035ABA25B
MEPAPRGEDKRHLLALYSALDEAGDEFSLPVLRALVTIAIQPGLSINELAERLGVPQQSASRYAAVLLGRYSSQMSQGTGIALVAQAVNPDEPRKRSLYLTPAGLDRIQRISNGMTARGESNVRR